MTRKAKLRAYKTRWQRDERHGLCGCFAVIFGIRVRVNLLEWLMRPV